MIFEQEVKEKKIYFEEMSRKVNLYKFILNLFKLLYIDIVYRKKKKIKKQKCN